MKTKITAIILILALVVSFALSGCSNGGVTELSQYNKKSIIDKMSGVYFIPENYSDFSVRLFDKCFEGDENTLVSPLSVALVFAMVLEGAEDETLEEIESVLDMSVDELRHLSDYIIRKTYYNKQLGTANSIWINNADDFSVNEEFLENNSEYHCTDIYKAKFNNKTVNEINKWVNKNTDGMIEKITDNLDERSVMCLINALLFDAKWEEVYDEHQISDGVFVTENADIKPVKYMSSSENLYIEDENAKGFAKYYEGRECAFVALLPDVGVSVDEYVSTLDGEKLDRLLENAQETEVRTKIPKFEYVTDLNLQSVLKDMGMEKAFDEEQADFSKLGQIQDGNIWIGDVLHSTKITVAEQGTKAGASTAVILYGDGAAPFEEKPKEVYLERPFVYMIVDANAGFPVFMGTVMSIDN